jgi:small-conductance mechanosensitive channel
LAAHLRWPAVFYGLLLAIYLSSLSVREWDYEFLSNRNWPLFENWLVALATLLTFYVGYISVVATLRFAAVRANRDPLDFLFIRKLAAAIFVVLAIVTTLNLLGYNVGPVLASLGVAGIAVALAAQETLGNYLASLSLTMDKALKPGDYIRLDSGQEGFVEAIGWRTTRIRPYGETMLIVPNTKLTSSIVTKFYLPENSVRVYIDFGVAYEENLQEVETILIQTASEVAGWVEGADTAFEPVVRFKEFAESNITGTLIVRAVDVI